MEDVKECKSPKMIPWTRFDEYKEKYKDNFFLDKTEDGIITAKWHTDGDSAYWDYPLHRGIHQLCHDVGQDSSAEVLIIGGYGDEYLKIGPTSMPEEDDTLKWLLYEHNYYDGVNMVEGLVNDVEQPTIGIINGPCIVHAEIALLCDITLIADDGCIADAHFMAGSIPGDGIQIAYRAALGIKRANYALTMHQKFSAEEALALGLVNEIVPKDHIYERALEIAREFTKQPRISRRVLTQTLRLPIKEQMAKELRTTFGTEMWLNYTNAIKHDEAFEKWDKELGNKKEH